MATLRTSMAQRASTLASAAKARTTGRTGAHGTRPARAPHHPGRPTSDLSHLIPELGSRATAESELAFELEDAASADLFGPTLEAAGSTTVFLVARAQVLQQRDAAHARADLNAALDALHRDADTQLKKMVTVPQELRQAVQRRLAMEEASAAGSSDDGSEREDFARHNREEAGQKISMQDLLMYAHKA